MNASIDESLRLLEPPFTMNEGYSDQEIILFFTHGGRKELYQKYFDPITSSHFLSSMIILIENEPQMISIKWSISFHLNRF